MVKRLRQNLLNQGRERLCEQMSEITGARAMGLYTDIDAQIGERVIVLTMDTDLEALCQRTAS